MITEAQPRIVGIGGTTRAGSSTERALRCSLQAAQDKGATTVIFAGEELAALPLYAPERSERTDLATRLVEEVRTADGVIMASPGYHGTVSGLVKNALDYLEDMRGDDRVYLSGLPVGVIATGAGWQAIGSTLSTLRDVVHALRGWVTPLGAGVRTVGQVFDAQGRCLDEHAALQLRVVGEEVVDFARWKAHSPRVPTVPDEQDV